MKIATDSSKPKILIVDDDPAMRDLLKTILKEEGIVFTANAIDPALEILRKEEMDIVLLDIMLGDANGMDLLKIIKNNYEKTEVIMITSVREIRTVVDAIKLGAYDYLTKDFEYNQVKLIFRKALEKRQLKQEVQLLKSEIKRYTQLDIVLGKSERIKEIHEIVQKIAKLPSNVLIQGESGTGKEVIARRIHALSCEGNDAYRPFISVNLASIPSELLESTLFGHEKGSFTGALRTHRGKFELANEGTLFLDEIGELQLELQAKLLRAIQEREIERVGGEQPIRINTRLVAATNQDLARLVEKGSFREDLYYRLNVIPLFLPPLRERLEDLPEFIDLFISKYSQRLGKKINAISSKALACLQAHSWPGNIRELENTIERMMALTHREILTEEDLPLELRFIDNHENNQPIHLDEILKRATDAFERGYILKVLERERWNQVKAAEALGIHRKTLEYKIKRHRLQELIESKRMEARGYKPEPFLEKTSAEDSSQNS